MAETTELDFNVSDEEIRDALKHWNDSISLDLNQIKSSAHPVLPKPDQKNVLITSALPYVNNVPHLGNLIGCCLSADIFAKYCRIKGFNTLFLCGTDEYGTTTETKALEEKLTCAEICAKYYKKHKEVYDWFNIEFDYFGRTSTAKQTEISQSIFTSLNSKGFVFEDKVEQLYCESCLKFLADRFVEGICPLCGYNDARGDQCDKCGKLINAIELKEPRCKSCSKTPVIRSSQHLFLDLPKLSPMLEDYLEKTIEDKENHWTNTASVITKSWIKEGLKPRCITRDLKWGTPVPLKGFEDKVFYVWFDAPIGYLSIAANYTEHWEKWFKSPDTVQYYQFMAKDNVPFHSVIFPSCLIGSDAGFTLCKHMSGIEYLNYEDGKFSKSRGTGVFGDQAKATEIESDIFRFYLAYIRPESMDSTFSWEDMMTKNNSELLNNLGNFINRALAFCEKNFGVIPAIKLESEDVKILARINQELKEYESNLDKLHLREGIRNILNISRIGNQYMQAKKPWVLVKGTDEEKIRGATIIGLCTNISYLLSLLIYPYMPNVSSAIRRQLNLPTFNVVNDKIHSNNSNDIKPGDYEHPVFHNHFMCFLKEGHKMGKPEPLFKRITDDQVKDLKVKYGGSQEKAVVTEAAKPAKTKKTAKPEKKPGEMTLTDLSKQQQSQLNRLGRVKEKLNQICDGFSMTDLKVYTETAEDLTTMQLSQFNRLDKLKNKLNHICDELSLSHLKIEFEKKEAANPVAKEAPKSEKQELFKRITTKVNAKKKIVDEIVIHLDPSSVPYSIYTLLNKLSLTYKCFAKFFIHGSIQKTLATDPKLDQKLKTVMNFFKELNLNQQDSRNSYDYGIMFIWKKMQNENLGPVMLLNNKTQIYGEAAILRYLNRFFKSSTNESFQSNDWMDKCTNELVQGDGLKYLSNLNENLIKSKDKFLASNDKPGLADYYNWASIKRMSSKVSKDKLTGINSWMQRLEETDLFIKLLNQRI